MTGRTGDERDRDASAQDERPTVAVFRPDDERLAEAVSLLRELGGDPIADPMLTVEPTDERPREDAEYAILTSKTGVELATAAGWDPGETTVCAIGPATAAALGVAGYAVDVVPEVYTSAGLVEHLRGDVDGARIEVARSDHGSPVLLEGLGTAGAYVHETILYRLTRPAASGSSTELAAAGALDAACFTSSLTVEHFVEAAAERGLRDDALNGLEAAVVGVIGPPTSETLADHGIDADVVASEATFEVLARETLAALD